MVLKDYMNSGDKSIGQVFTPKYVAKFMVKNIVQILSKSETNFQELRVLEPSVGKGIFLKLLKWYWIDLVNLHQ